MSFERVEELLASGMPHADAIEYLLGKPITAESAPVILSELEEHLKKLNAAVGDLRRECSKMKQNHPNS